MSRELDLDRHDRVSVIAPHPDDETLAAGGLLQHAVAAGARIQVLLATDGDVNPWAQRAVELRWRLDAADHGRWGIRRRGETVEALRRLGVPPSAVTFLGFRDQSLTDLVCGRLDDGVAPLAHALRTFRPTVVAAPALTDRHPDHSALAVLVRLALRRAALVPQVLAYLVHPPRGGLVASARTCCVRLTGAQIACKRSAILAHRSQLRLHPRALLDFASVREPFVVARPECWRMPGGPVRRVDVEGDVLRIALARVRGLGLLGARVLLVATDDRGAGDSWHGVLPREGGSIRLAHRGRTHAVAGRVVPDRDGGELVLPRAIVAGAIAAFLKLERRFGSFDQRGFAELPLAESAERSPTTRPLPAHGAIVPASRPNRDLCVL